MMAVTDGSSAEAASIMLWAAALLLLLAPVARAQQPAAPGAPEHGLRSFDIASPITGDGYQQYGFRTNVTNTGAAPGYGDRFACLSNASGAGFELCRSSLMFDLAPAPNGTAYQSFWMVHVSPNDASHTWSAIASEINMVNRGDDKGYLADPAVNRFVGGEWFVPEANLFGYPGHARNVDFGWGVASSSGANDLGKRVKTYNGFIAYADSIAPNGRAFVARGATSADGKDAPFAPLELRDAWRSGIRCDGAAFADGACLTLGPAQALAFMQPAAGGGKPPRGAGTLATSPQPDAAALLLRADSASDAVLTLQNQSTGRSGQDAIRFVEPDGADGTPGCQRGAIGYGNLRAPVDAFTRQMFVAIGDGCAPGDAKGTSFSIVNTHARGAGEAGLSGTGYRMFVAGENGSFDWNGPAGPLMHLDRETGALTLPKAPLPVASGGTGTATGAWTPYRPAVTLTGGAGATGTPVEAAYLALGKTLFFRATIRIAYASAPPDAVHFALPEGARAAGAQAFAGVNLSTGAALSAYSTGDALVTLKSVTATAPVTGADQMLVASGTAQIR